MPYKVKVSCPCGVVVLGIRRKPWVRQSDRLTVIGRAYISLMFSNCQIPIFVLKNLFFREMKLPEDKLFSS